MVFINKLSILNPWSWSTSTSDAFIGKETISTISVCNVNSSSATYSIYIVPSWWSYWNTNAFVFWDTINWNQTITFTLWLTPESWQTIVVYASTANLNFFISYRKYT